MSWLCLIGANLQKFQDEANIRMAKKQCASI